MLQVIQATAEHLPGILSLQQVNLLESISAEEARQEGFVTVKHNLDLLARMNAYAPHTVLVSDGLVQGYALTMGRDFRFEIEILMPMFAHIDRMEYRGIRMEQADYMVMGQVCIAKPQRGKGMFNILYNGMRRFLQSRFDFCITEVSTQNRPSMRAHTSAGLDVAEVYSRPHKGEWAVFVWDWRNKI